MPKINREEYEVLKALDSRAKSIVRQARGWLWVAEQPIMKDDRSWFVADGFDEKLKDDNLFQFIQWEDEEPHNIAELIEEYESEGIEVRKDKLWAKNKIQEELESWRNIEGGIDRDGIKYVLNIIDQLDEPEVLSQEWIDEHKVARVNNLRKMTMSDVVPVDELQDLLVPKREELESKIKALIEAYKQEEDAYGELENGWISGFIKDLKNLVEEEQKYYVSERDEEYGGFWFLSKNDNGDISIGVNRDWSEVDWDRLKLTEQEIKDYDERYWAFAEEVTHGDF